jgi:hypothetical protein
MRAGGIGRGGPAAAYVCVMNVDGTNPRTLTRMAGSSLQHAVLVAGRPKILFDRERDGNVMNAYGSGQQNVSRNPASERSPTGLRGRKDG